MVMIAEAGPFCTAVQLGSIPLLGVELLDGTTEGTVSADEDRAGGAKLRWAGDGRLANVVGAEAEITVRRIRTDKVRRSWKLSTKSTKEDPYKFPAPIPEDTPTPSRKRCGPFSSTQHQLKHRPFFQTLPSFCDSLSPDTALWADPL